MMKILATVIAVFGWGVTTYSGTEGGFEWGYWVAYFILANFSYLLYKGWKLW